MSEADFEPELASPRDIAKGTETAAPLAVATAASSAAVSTQAGAVPGAADGGKRVDLATAAANMTGALPEDGLTASIQELKKQQNALREQKAKLAKDLRNAERRKKRLRTRARQLTDEDLVQVLMLRKQQRNERPSTEAASAASSSTASSSTSAASNGGSSASGAASSSSGR